MLLKKRSLLAEALFWLMEDIVFSICECEAVAVQRLASDVSTLSLPPVALSCLNCCNLMLNDTKLTTDYCLVVTVAPLENTSCGRSPIVTCRLESDRQHGWLSIERKENFALSSPAHKSKPHKSAFLSLDRKYRISYEAFLAQRPIKSSLDWSYGNAWRLMNTLCRWRVYLLRCQHNTPVMHDLSSWVKQLGQRMRKSRSGKIYMYIYIVTRRSQRSSELKKNSLWLAPAEDFCKIIVTCKN